MTVYTLVPGFLHQHFSYTRAALLGKPNVEVEFDKELALSHEVLLYEAHPDEKVGTSQPLSFAREEQQGLDTLRSEVKVSAPASSVIFGEVVIEKPAPAAEVPKLTTVTPQAFSGKGFFSTKIGQLLLSLVIGLSFVVMLVVLAPSLYYHLFPADTVPVEALEEGTPLGGAFAEREVPAENVVEPVLPPKDETLPEGMWLIIPKIGVRTPLDPTLSSEEALMKGVWMTPDYGMPGDRTQPVILAAHRYGWKWWWQSDYWQYHSFYLLPDLQPGDIVEVISDQRKYYYEIYAGEEGDLITDYTADMILYTCKFLNSPVRHLRYARLIDMTKDTQS
jgi:sortase (surface protein transpeptidase)